MTTYTEVCDGVEYYYGELIVIDTPVDDEDKYYDQGMTTFKSGGKRSDNPYNIDLEPNAYNQWNQGFFKAIWNQE